ncbi:hypothetical protein A0H81_06246 [Grifola frondosa]|uniref:Uncharacterized protein n=1 Tax=Grifola frondosa TaxID=5627 RepID=A0A1C7MB44_GRIFR|nr:hypothetical protein A0H81_06246 [Grifola frondosa]
MSATNCTLRISPADGPLATCTPNLMPFHIAYSGPAPISTYFRVQPAPLPSFGQNTSDMSSQTTNSPVLDDAISSQSTLVASSSASTSQSSVTTQVSSIAAEDVEMKTEDSQGLSTARRFVSAFRGRVLQGLEVDLPIGSKKADKIKYEGQGEREEGGDA